jgi:hypothetical protein
MEELKMSNYLESSNAFYIQNVLPGQLVICDPLHIRDGLHLNPLLSGEIMNLSYYEKSVLARSLALQDALDNFQIYTKEQVIENRINVTRALKHGLIQNVHSRQHGSLQTRVQVKPVCPGQFGRRRVGTRIFCPGNRHAGESLRSIEVGYRPRKNRDS